MRSNTRPETEPPCAGATPIRNEKYYDLWKTFWKPIYAGLYALILAAVVLLGRLIGIDQTPVKSFVALILFASAAAAYGTTLGLERLIFGRIPLAPVSPTFKVLFTIGMILVVALCVLDGIDAQSHDASNVPVYVPSLQTQMFKNVNLPTPADIDRLRQLAKERSPTSQP